jgi:hypothetical protein
LRKIANRRSRIAGLDVSRGSGFGEIFFETGVRIGPKGAPVSAGAGRREDIRKSRRRPPAAFSIFWLKIQSNFGFSSVFPSIFRRFEMLPFFAADRFRGDDFPGVAGKSRLTFFYPIATNSSTSDGAGRRRNESGRDADVFQCPSRFPPSLPPSAVHYLAESFGSPQGSRISNGSSNLPEDRRHWQPFRRRRLFP